MSSGPQELSVEEAAEYLVAVFNSDSSHTEDYAVRQAHQANFILDPIEGSGTDAYSTVAVDHCDRIQEVENASTTPGPEEPAGSGSLSVGNATQNTYHFIPTGEGGSREAAFLTTKMTAQQRRQRPGEYRCALCHDTFTTLYRLQTHENRFHLPEDEKQIFRCPECQTYTTAYKSDMPRHLAACRQRLSPLPETGTANPPS